MRHMIHIAVLAFAGCMMSNTDTQAAEENPVIQTVLKTEHECDEALIKGDIARLEEILSDDVTRTTPDGKLTNKAEWLGSIKEGRVKYVSLRREGTTVRLYGETAVVTGLVTIKFQASGVEQERKNRYLRLYVKRMGHWMLVAHQATHIEQR